MRGPEEENRHHELIRQPDTDELPWEDAFAVLVTRDVFLDIYGEELSKIKAEPERALALNKKRAIFADALRRGHEVIEEKLTTEGISLDSNDRTLQKTYKYDDKGILKWKVDSKDKDPFARLDFLNNARIAGFDIEGESVGLYTESELVQMVFEEGKSKQDKLYNQFTQAVSAISFAEYNSTHFLPYIPNTIEIGLSEVKKVKAQIENSDLSTDPKEAFILQYVVTEHPFLNMLDSSINIANSIANLRSFFGRDFAVLPDGQKVPTNEIKQLRSVNIPIFENTLIIELLTNPESLVSLNDLRSPETSIERVKRVYQALDKLKHRASKDTIRDIYIIVAKTIEDQASNLSNLFSQFSIDPKVGLEYLQNLMFETLKTLPGREYVNLGKTRQSPEINGYFNLVDPVFIPANPEKSGGTTILGRNAIEMFANKFLRDNQLEFEVLMSYSQRDRVRVVEEILNKAKGVSEFRYGFILTRLIHGFGIKYESIEEIGSNNKSYFQSERFVSARRDFLASCQRRIKEGDEEQIIKVFDEELVTNVVSAYLKANMPKRVSMSSLMRGISLSGLDRDAAINKAITYAAYYALSRRYNPADYNRRATKISHIIDTQMNNANRIFAEMVISNLVDYDTYIPNIGILSHRSLRFAEDFVRTAKLNSLPEDYDENKSKYIIRAIDLTLL